MPEFAWFLIQEEIFPPEDTVLFLRYIDESETELIKAIKKTTNISE